MSSKIVCGPCGYEDNIKNAKKWCTNCEEGFCEDCEKVHRSTKMSRNHTLIFVSDYHKIKDVAISQTCVGHGKRYDLYCSIHDKPLCIDCVDQHKSCPQLVSLDNAAANAKESTALADLEDTINGALQNIGKCIKKQETNDKEFDKQENLIKKTIQKTRENLNKHLDLLEQKLIKDLSSKSINCKSAYAKMLRQLNLADTKLSQLKEEMETMKQMASDIQIFLGTREINKTVSEEIKSIKTMLIKARCFQIKLEIEPSVTLLSNSVEQLGILSVVEKNPELEFKDAKIDQAQNQVSVLLVPFRVIDLELKQQFKSRSSSRVSSCLILPNGHMLICDCWGKSNIAEYDEQGNKIRDIACTDKPYYLTLTHSDTIAVTYLSRSYIEIINLNKKHVQTITLQDACRGISYQDSKLYVVVIKTGIVVLDLSGKILNTLAINTTHVFDIATAKDRIYYTRNSSNTIHCSSMIGQDIWTYTAKSITSIEGLAITGDQDVFVAGNSSNNLAIINQNGLESRILLTDSDGLIQPRAIYYNKNRNELLVCNERNEEAAVYKVIVG